MNLKRITVGLVCYNEEKNIERCLTSLLAERNQSFLHQIIVIDNCSTDETPQYLEKWKSLYPHLITLVPSRENLIGKARQMVVDLCQTEWLAFTDGDCVVPPDWLETFVKHRQEISEAKDEKPIAGLCGPNQLPSHQDWQNFIRVFLNTPFGHGGSPQAMNPKSRKEVNHLPTTNAFYSLTALKTTSGFVPSLMVGEDAQMGQQLSKLGFKMIMCPSPMVINHSADSLKEWHQRMKRFGRAQWTHSPWRSRVLLFTSPFWLLLGFLFLPLFCIFTFFSALKRVKTLEALKCTMLGGLTLFFYSWGFLKLD